MTPTAHITNNVSSQEMTDSLMAKTGLSQAELVRTLLPSFLKMQPVPSKALDMIYQQFPQLPKITLTPQEKALDALAPAYDEHANEVRIRKAIQFALKIDPYCTEAYLLEHHLLMDEDIPFVEEIALLDKAVATGRKAIDVALAQEDGAQTFEDWVGEFWYLPCTRGYMNALERLAHTYWYFNSLREKCLDVTPQQAQQYVEARQKAINLAQELLRLNPEDSQGIRYALLSWLMAENRWEEAEALWRDYEDDATALWLYGHAFILNKRHGPKAVATRQAFEIAVTRNPFVVATFLEMEMPEDLEKDLPPGAYSLGGLREAQYFWRTLENATSFQVPYAMYAMMDAHSSDAVIDDATLQEFQAFTPNLLRLFDQQLEILGIKKFEKLMMIWLQKQLQASDQALHNDT